jgi:hypothetical protein
MLINTLFSKNIPGEIIIPVDEIVKTKSNTKEFSGEETLASMPRFTDPSEIIVDNEDPGFISSRLIIVSPLKKILGIKNRNGQTYEQVRTWNTPEYWKPVVLTSYYGRYVRSAVYTRSGKGDKVITWTSILKDPGYYDVYCYIGKTSDHMMVRSPGGQSDQDGLNQGENPYKEMHYKIFHDEGVEDITLDYEKAEGGWNSLGRYYLSGDTAKVSLTNQSAGRIVIGDAVKWVKQN